MPKDKRYLKRVLFINVKLINSDLSGFKSYCLISP